MSREYTHAKTDMQITPRAEIEHAYLYTYGGSTDVHIDFQHVVKNEYEVAFIRQELQLTYRQAIHLRDALGMLLSAPIPAEMQQERVISSGEVVFPNTDEREAERHAETMYDLSLEATE